MSEEKEKSQKGSKKVLFKNKEMTIEEFISVKGGIQGLDRKALLRKYGEENKSGQDWMKLLVKYTIIDKNSDNSFLNRETN